MPNSTQSTRLDDVEKELAEIRENMAGLRTELREHRELSRDRHQAILDKIDSSSHGSPPTPKGNRPVLLGIVPGTAREIVMILGGIATAAGTIYGAYLGAAQATAGPAATPAAIHQPVHLPPEAP